MGLQDRKNFVGQLTGGRIDPGFRESCIEVAEGVFAKRAGKDSNPMIARVVRGGERIGHWYYRSDEWIYQPFFAMSLVMPYEGPARLAKIAQYGEGRYERDEEATEYAMRLLKR